MLDVPLAHIAVADTIRALVVFARFPDEVSSTSCYSTDWPDPDEVPAWADSLVEGADPDTVGSLTHFFHLMSGGKHLVYGDVFAEVVVTDSSIAFFDGTYSDDNEAVRRANMDVTRQVIVALGNDAADYDLNGDGYLDHMHIVYHGFKSTTSGRELFRGFNAISHHVQPESTFTLPDSSTIMVDESTGSCQRPILVGSAPYTYRRSRGAVFDEFKHEYFHRIQYAAGAPFSQVPAGHFPQMAGYGIMDGTYLGNGQFIDGWTLWQLGWASPTIVDFGGAGGDTTLVLPAVPDPGAYAVVKTGDTNQQFILEVRNHDSFYAQGHGAGTCGSEAGPMGLLVAHTITGTTQGTAPHYAPLVATGRFRPDYGFPDPYYGKDRIEAYEHCWFTVDETDLLKPGNVNVLGPFTNPGTGLYEKQEASEQYWSDPVVDSGVTIYNVEWMGDDDYMTVSIHVDPSPGSAAADTIRNHMRWDGLVQLTGDLVVDSGVHLTIEDSSRVVSRALADRFHGGSDGDRVEILVRGTLEVRGYDEGVDFTSSRDLDFETWLGHGEVGETPAAGDWRGIHFLDTDPSADPSSLSGGDFDFSVFPVEVDSLGCTLYHNRFQHSSAADIWVPADVRIPAGEAWDLWAPTHVLVNDHDPLNRGEDTAHVEILSHGGFSTSRPAGATPQDSVWFTPTGTSPTAGSWAGIAAEYWEAKGSIKDASIGYAVNPVRYTYLAYAGSDTATVQHSTLHHYTGIGILDEWSRTSVIGNTLLGSGATVTDSGAVAAVKSILSIPRIEDNTIAWHKEHGIKLEWAKVACSNISVEDSVFVTGNTLQGGGEDSDQMQTGTGLAVSWGCPKRHVRIVDNDIADWRERGVDLTQCADTRLACNAIHDNNQGVHHSRDLNQAATEPNRLRANSIIDSYDVNLWLDDATKFKLYNSGATGYAKDNSFMPDSADANGVRYNISQQDPYNVLDAQATFWRSGSGQALGTDPAFWSADSAYLAARVTGYPANVSITNPLDEATELCQVGGGGSQQGGGSRELAGDEPGRSTVRLSARVDQRALDRTVFVLDTSGFVGRARVRVYDVRGRLVAVPFEDEALASGHHEVAWNRRDMTGMPVASGVYFVRLETAIGSSTGKVVVVR